MQVILSPQARTDLASIRDYIEEHNPRAALRVATELVALCERLGHLPDRGRPGKAAGTREITSFWPYVIVYRVTSEAVEIMRTHHGRKDW